MLYPVFPFPFIYISQWLTPERIADGRRTAIVLCNEGLLQAVVHCLPDEVDKVNVTTGYPLLQTPVIIKCADHVIDLGPDGGDKGGNLVIAGTPEEVARCRDSLTGYYLKDKLT